MTKHIRAPEGDIELGLRGEKVRLGDHIAYFWEREHEFEEAVKFLVLGIRQGEHAVVFGHDDANEKVLGILRRSGLDTTHLQASNRLSVIGGGPTGEQMLGGIGAKFQQAVQNGSRCIRLLGNIGWAKPGWPDELDILAFEAKVTGAARQFPCVVMCMYDVGHLSGTVMVHGAYETHPLTFCGNVLRENPHYVEVDQFLLQLEAMEDRAKVTARHRSLSAQSDATLTSAP
ncbi:MAG TPA: MEDS domain-containing protein [Gemmatimonadaceae bacterium]|nr:MEDS domain-containing protein [Gemmatimonadaceae bacterium]